MLWEVKSTSWIFMSSYGGKLVLYICKLEWFKSKQIWVDENVFICSLEPYRAVNSDRDLATLFCVQGEIFVVCTLVSSGNITIYFGGGGTTGFWLFDIASLVMYCNDAILRIVTKSLYRTAPPFSSLNGAAIRWRETTPHQPIQAEQIPAFPLSRSFSYMWWTHLKVFILLLSFSGSWRSRFWSFCLENLVRNS